MSRVMSAAAGFAVREAGSAQRFTARSASVKQSMEPKRMNARKRQTVRTAALSCLLLFLHSVAYGWYDKTHLTIAKVAGYERGFNAVGADIAKIKAGNIGACNHIFNNNKNGR